MVDVPLVVVECAQLAPVFASVAPVPSVSHAALALEAEDTAAAPSVFHAVQAHVDVCIAPAPAVAYTAAPMIDYFTPSLAVTYTAKAPVDDFTYAAPTPSDVSRHTMERIIGAPVPQVVEEIVSDAFCETSASSSAPSPPAAKKGEHGQAQEISWFYMTAVYVMTLAAVSS